MKRLEEISKLIKGKYLCDVGTDHGYLPLICFNKGIIEKAQLVDNKIKPLESAKKNLQKYQDKCLFLLQDGIQNLDSDIDVISICGMGGELIIKILEANKNLDNISLVLQANNNVSKLRKWLVLNNFFIENEKLIFDKHYYEVILCKKNKDKNIMFSKEELDCGVYLSHEKENLAYFINKYNKIKKHIFDNEKIKLEAENLENVINNLKNQD